MNIFVLVLPRQLSSHSYIITGTAIAVQEAAGSPAVVRIRLVCEGLATGILSARRLAVLYILHGGVRVSKSGSYCHPLADRRCIALTLRHARAVIHPCKTIRRIETRVAARAYFAAVGRAVCAHRRRAVGAGARVCAAAAAAGVKASVAGAAGLV